MQKQNKKPIHLCLKTVCSIIFPYLIGTNQAKNAELHVVSVLVHYNFPCPSVRIIRQGIWNYMLQDMTMIGEHLDFSINSHD